MVFMILVFVITGITKIYILIYYTFFKSPHISFTSKKRLTIYRIIMETAKHFLRNTQKILS